MSLAQPIPEPPIKVVALITVSLAELDILLPVFRRELLRKPQIQYLFVMTKPDIFERYSQSPFYVKAIADLRAEVKTLFLSEKTDSWLRWPFRFLTCFTHLNLLWRVLRADHIFHEVSRFDPLVRLALSLKPVLRSTRFWAHLHGHSIHVTATLARVVRKPAPHSTMLLISKRLERDHKMRGYDKQLYVGAPKFYEDWIDYIKTFPLVAQGGHVVIYSRRIHEKYMEEKQFEFMFTSCLDVVEKVFPESKIVIKLHPREDPANVLRILGDRAKNVLLDFGHPAVSAQNALFTVSLQTSSIFDAAALGVPSVEYFIDSDGFRESFDGSYCKYLGFASVDNPDDLEQVARAAKEGRLSPPDIITELRDDPHAALF